MKRHADQMECSGDHLSPLRKSHFSEKENLQRNGQRLLEVQQSTVQRLFQASRDVYNGNLTPAELKVQESTNKTQLMVMEKDPPLVQTTSLRREITELQAALLVSKDRSSQDQSLQRQMWHRFLLKKQQLAELSSRASNSSLNLMSPKGCSGCNGEAQSLQTTLCCTKSLCSSCAKSCTFCQDWLCQDCGLILRTNNAMDDSFAYSCRVCYP